MKKIGVDRLKCAICESAAIPDIKPSPRGEGAPKGRRLDGDTAIPDTKPSPRGEGGERSEPDRVLAV